MNGFLKNQLTSRRSYQIYTHTHTHNTHTLKKEVDTETKSTTSSEKIKEISCTKDTINKHTVK